MMVAAALFKGLDIPLVRLAAVWAISVVGTLPFCAIGLFIGSRVSGRSAPAWVNLAYLPVTWHVGALAGITVLFAGLAAHRVMKMD